MGKFILNCIILIFEVFLVLFALQLVYIDTKKVNDSTNGYSVCVSNVKKIQYDIAMKMTTYTQGLWNVTPNDQNVQFSPIIETIGRNLGLIQIYYERGLRQMYPKNRFLEVPFELASILDKLQQSRGIELKFKNALFYDNCCTNAEYLEDLRLYYHCELIKIYYTENNTQPIKFQMERWISANTRNRQPQSEDLLMPNLAHFSASVLQLTGCWSKPKMVADQLVFNFDRRSHQRSRRYVPIPKLPTINFSNASKLDIEAFTADDIVGYYNDYLVGFQAIRLPFQKHEFVMAILLPYPNLKLDLFAKFTPDDYTLLMERLKNKGEHIEFTIPTLNIPMFSMNQNGVKINSAGPIQCDSLPNDHKRVNTTIFNYPKFVVDRPYGIIVYHEPTNLVLWQAWIRDPTSNVYVSRKFLKHAKKRGELLDRNHIA